MMTSSNGNIFRITGHLCGEFAGHRRIPLPKVSLIRQFRSTYHMNFIRNSYEQHIKLNAHFPWGTYEFINEVRITFICIINCLSIWTPYEHNMKFSWISYEIYTTYQTIYYEFLLFMWNFVTALEHFRNCSGTLISDLEDLKLLRKTCNCSGRLKTAPEHFCNCSGWLS